MSIARRLSNSALVDNLYESLWMPSINGSYPHRDPVLHHAVHYWPFRQLLHFLSEICITPSQHILLNRWSYSLQRRRWASLNTFGSYPSEKFKCLSYATGNCQSPYHVSHIFSSTFINSFPCPGWLVFLSYTSIPPSCPDSTIYNILEYRRGSQGVRWCLTMN